MVLFFYFRDFTTLISPQVKRRGACENQDEGVKEMASRCFCKLSPNQTQSKSANKEVLIWTVF